MLVMTLLETCQTLLKRIRAVQNVQTSVAESKQLRLRLQEAQEIQNAIIEAADMIRFLTANGLPVAVGSVEIAKGSQPLQNIIKRFSESQQASSLTKGKDWVRLEESSGEIEDALKKRAGEAWREYASNLYSGQTPENLNASLAMTDTNRKALEEYKKIYSELGELKNRFPEDATDINRSKKYAEKLKEIVSAFDFDVPEDVKIFLEAVAHEGATLDLLTDGVVEWLSENQSQRHYKIVGTQ